EDKQSENGAKTKKRQPTPWQRSQNRACLDYSCRKQSITQTLFHKVWDAHTARKVPSGQTQLFVGLHLVHEVTTPQSFDMLRQDGWTVAFPDRTFGTIDHIVPTRARTRPFLDVMAEEMTASLERNCREYGISLWTADAE